MSPPPSLSGQRLAYSRPSRRGSCRGSGERCPTLRPCQGRGCPAATIAGNEDDTVAGGRHPHRLYQVLQQVLYLMMQSLYHIRRLAMWPECSLDSMRLPLAIMNLVNMAVNSMHPKYLSLIHI